MARTTALVCGIRRFCLAGLPVAAVLLASSALLNAQDAPAAPKAEAAKPEMPKADAPKTDAPKDAAKPSPLKSPAFIDHADVKPPKESFEYWLQTVSTTDEEFAAVLAKTPGYDADKKFTPAELRTERKKRLYQSFDFDAYFEAGHKADDEPQTREQRDFNEKMLVDLYLGTVTRDAYSARNIRAINAPEPPDWNTGKATILLDMFSTVEKRVLRYRVNLKLYEKGLCWRWYSSENLGDAPTEKPVAGSDAAAKAMDAAAVLEREIAALIEKIEADKKAVGDAETRIAAATAQLDQKRAEKIELERVANPYGTPELALRTAYRAMRDKNWDNFKQSHSKAVRDAAGDAAKGRFETTSKANEVKSITILETTEDPVDKNKVKLKVRLTVVYRSKAGYDSEEKQTTVEPSEERRVATVTPVKEDGRWLLDDPL
jgi:hypothetical protein